MPQISNPSERGPAKSKISEHSKHSMLRENILEHLLIGDLLRVYWRKNIYDVEILRSEFDAFGYDMVLSKNKIVRHIQLKSAKDRFAYYVVPSSLRNRSSACVVVVVVDNKLKINGYYWYGNKAGSAIPEFPEPITKKGKSMKTIKNGRAVIERQHFAKLKDIEELAHRLIDE